MKIIYQLKIGDFAPSESTRSFTQEGYLKCVNVRLAKAPHACTITSLKSTTTYYVRVAARDVWQSTSWNYSDQLTQATTEG